jgi:putative chitinase
MPGLSISLDQINKLWPHGDSKIPGLRAAIAEHSEAVFAKWQFDTPDIIAIFLGQVSLECGGGTEVVENLNYTARRMMAVWPRRFPTLASALPYASNPAKLAEKVYAGRMGNVPGTGMAAKYIGRGGSQTTGHDGYEALGEVTGLDLLNEPELVNDVRYFLESAAADFVKCGCLPFARRGDIESVTHHLNGGLTGLADRVAWTKRCRSALGAAAIVKPADDGVLRFGSKGFEVEALQKRLVALGYHVGTVDQDYGRSTRTAVFAFKADRGLPITDEIDLATKEALKRDLAKPVSEQRMNATADDLADAGSKTIASANSGSMLAVAKGTLGSIFVGGGAVEKMGLLDTAQSGIDKANQAKGIWGSFCDLAKPVFAGPAPIVIGLVLIAAAIAAYFLFEQIKARRVADHNSGAHAGPSEG